MAWRKKAATMAVGAAGAALAFGAQRSVMIKNVGDPGNDGKDKDWRRTGNRFQIMSNKIGSILHTFVSQELPCPAWEYEIASMPGLVQNFQVSHMAQSSTDGLLFVGLPRVYQPKTGYSEAEQKADEERRASSSSAGAGDATQGSSSSSTQVVEVKRDAFGQPAGLPGRDTFCVWHFGKDAVGHPDTVHGGAIAMAIDESCGHAFMSLGRGPGYTAFLHVNYRQPMPAGHPALVKVVVEKIDRRKVFLHAILTDGNNTKFADAECLFVVPRPTTAPVDPPGYISA